MHAKDEGQQSLQTEAGPFPLREYRLRLAGRTWGILHTHAVLTYADEVHFARELRDRLPYGVALWPSAIALAHEVAARADELRGRRVLELGAGTGLPGIVAASFGAQVLQTDRQELALDVCRRNGARNGVAALELRQADWTAWEEAGHFDWIIGSDILYGEGMHPHLRQIFARNLAPGGRVLLADPFRAISLGLLEALEAEGWGVAVSTWGVGEEEAMRKVGLFELAPPR